MDVGKVVTFLQRIGCDKISVGAEWVRSTCPCGVLHRGGRDNTPSFAISIKPGDSSHCKCLGCDTSGDLMSLLWRIERLTGRKHLSLLSFLSEHNQLDYERWDPDNKPVEPDDYKGRLRRSRDYVVDSSRISRFVHPDDEPQAEVPEAVLQAMRGDIPTDVWEYLTRSYDRRNKVDGRGLDRETIEAWELGWHAAEGRICIPIRDETGQLVSISGRKYGESGKAKYLHSPFKRDRVLYGAHKLVPGRKGYLVEGFFQVMYPWRHGYRNFVARMGSHLSALQALKLVEWFDHLVVIPDGDVAGYSSAKLIVESLKGRIPKVEMVDMPRGRDVDTVSPEQLSALIGPTFVIDNPA